MEFSYKVFAHVGPKDVRPLNRVKGPTAAMALASAKLANPGVAGYIYLVPIIRKAA